MIRKMSAKEQAKWQARVITFGKEVKAIYGAEKAAMMIWNKCGVLAGTKNGDVELQFGKEKVTL